MKGRTLNKRITALAGIAAAGALLISGCAADGEGGSGAEGPITIAVFNGWDEGIVTSELWEAVLTEQGYDVELEYADVAPVFVGLEGGDYDLTFDIWLPGTHAEYLAEYGNSIEDLGAWNNQSKLTIAVNADAPINSLEELAANAALFGNRIVGIEPGAGLTLATEGGVIPGYGLEGMEYLTSSTAAMLAELEAASRTGENIVVTLWEPHWAYGVYSLKNLEDPQGALGGAESIHTYSRLGFSDDYPEVATWLNNFKMDLDTLYSLENALLVEYTGNNRGPVLAQWIEENRAWVDSLTQ